MKNKIYAVGFGIIIGIFVGAFLSSVTGAEANCEQAIVAGYDENGRMTQVNFVPSGDYYNGVANGYFSASYDNTSMAKVFVVDDGVPVCESVEIENPNNTLVLFDGANSGSSIRKLVSIAVSEMSSKGGGDIVIVTHYCEDTYFTPTEERVVDSAHENNIRITIVSLGGTTARKYLLNYCDYFIEAPTVKN